MHCNNSLNAQRVNKYLNVLAKLIDIFQKISENKYTTGLKPVVYLF